MKLSPTMQHCVEFIRKHGKICRYPGGFWREPDYRGDPAHGFSFGTSTIDALEKRGIIEYCEYRDGRRGRFPVAVVLIAGNS